MGANEETIQALEKHLREAGLLYSNDLGERIWNCDESGLCNAVTAGKILAKKGSHWVHDTTRGSGHSYITIHGIWLPPFVVYKGKNLYIAWTKEYQLEKYTLQVLVAGWRRKIVSHSSERCFF